MAGPKKPPKASPALLGRRQSTVENRARTLSRLIRRWLVRYTRDVIDEELKKEGVRGARVTMPKGRAKQKAMRDELTALLNQYGLRMATDSGKVAVGVPPIIPAKVISEILRDKEIKVQRLAAETKQRIRGAIKEILQEGAEESPQPTVAMIAQRIRAKFDDDPSFGFTVSTGRAERIARTELAQSQNTGIISGFQTVGIKRMEWLAYNDGRSGKRQHNRMDGQTVEVGKKFTNPTTGKKLRYPGDPAAPISETANCRCTIAPVED